MIRIDYAKAIREANRLQTTANECQTMCSLIDTLLRDMPAYWEGDSEKQFEAELAQWKRETLSIKTELSSLSKTVKKVANDIKEAEERAIAAIKNGGGGRGF